MALKDSWGLLKDTFKEWREDQATRFAAALAFYTMLSIAPLLFLVIGIAGLVFGQRAAEGRLVNELQGTVGPQAAQLLQTAISNVSETGTSTWATIAGVALLLVGATTVFGELQRDLNTVWDVKPIPSQGIWGLVRTRLLSVGMILVIGFLLLVSLVLSAVMTSVGAFLTDLVPGMQILLQVLDLLLSVAVITLLFAAIFRFLPDVEISWHDVWVGALVTAALFSIGKHVIGLYLGQTTMASTFGAAGALVILLLWVYYSAQILFFGAEFTQVQARRRGSRVKPAPYARRTE